MRIMIGLLLLGLCLQPLWAEEEKQLDVRVLIDVSGSMKKNDPKNLRQPALRLLAGLLPDGIHAGVWIFDRDVSVIAPLQPVDEAWRQMAIQGSQDIHSKGQFTHIEGGLQVAVGDWYQPDPTKNRHLILLTDGMVDVSHTPADSKASRQRILKGVLADLKAAGARVHSIALSRRADLELLKTLSRETSGLNESINNADRMQRIFMRLFQQAGQPDTLPLKDNRFQVDAGIREATVILFTGTRAGETRLIDPAQRNFTAQALPPNIRWHVDQGYELITIKRPEPGEWQVVADMDPDNRVMVVTDLKMRLGELPVVFLAQEQPEVRVHFTDQGEKLTEADFVKIVTVVGELIGGTRAYSFALNPLPDEGDFVAAPELPVQPGRYQLVLTGKSETFSREARHQFEVRKALEVSHKVAAEQVNVYLEILPDSLSDARISAILTTEQADIPQIVLPMQVNRYEVEVATLAFSGQAALQFSVAGVHNGKQVVLRPDPLVIKGTKPDLPPPSPEPEAEPVVEAEPEPEQKTEPPSEVQAEVEAETEEEQGFGLIGWLLFGAGNLLVLLLAGAGWWFWRRRKAASEWDDLDEDEANGDAND